MTAKELIELIYSEAEDGKTDNEILCKILRLEGVKDAKEQLEKIRRQLNKE